MKQTLLFGMTSLLLLSVSAGCGSKSSQSKSTIPPDLTVEQVYDSVERAIGSGDGNVLHAVTILDEVTVGSGTPVSIAETVSDYKPEDYANEIWLDAATNSVRTEQRTRRENKSAVDVSKEIQHAGARFSVDERGNSSNGAAASCHESASVLVAVLMGCVRDATTSAVRVGEHDGESVILVITRGMGESDGSKTYFEHTVSVDPATYLPVSDEAKSSHDPNLDTYDYSMTRRYDIEFMSRSSLADDFFEPSAIGYVVVEPVAAENLRRDVDGMRVYWVGPEFDAGLAAPLTLERVAVYPGISPRAGASLSYKLPGNTGYRGVGIDQFPIDLGDRTEADVLGGWNKSDTVREDVSIQGRRAELIRFRDTRYGEVYLMRIDFETTIVTVHDYLGAPPYTGRDAILRIAEALRPYEE